MSGHDPYSNFLTEAQEADIRDQQERKRTLFRAQQFEMNELLIRPDIEANKAHAERLRALSLANPKYAQNLSAEQLVTFIYTQLLHFPEAPWDFHVSPGLFKFTIDTKLFNREIESKLIDEADLEGPSIFFDRFAYLITHSASLFEKFARSDLANLLPHFYQSFVNSIFEAWRDYLDNDQAPALKEQCLEVMTAYFLGPMSNFRYTGKFNHYAAFSKKLAFAFIYLAETGHIEVAKDFATHLIAAESAMSGPLMTLRGTRARDLAEFSVSLQQFHLGSFKDKPVAIDELLKLIQPKNAAKISPREQARANELRKFASKLRTTDPLVYTDAKMELYEFLIDQTGVSGKGFLQSETAHSKRALGMAACLIPLSQSDLQSIAGNIATALEDYPDPSLATETNPLHHRGRAETAPAASTDGADAIA